MGRSFFRFKNMVTGTKNNEIDAKRYLLNIADKYGIPRSEINETKEHLKYYENALNNYYREEGANNDKNN